MNLYGVIFGDSHAEVFSMEVEKVTDRLIKMPFSHKAFGYLTNIRKDMFDLVGVGFTPTEAIDRHIKATEQQMEKVEEELERTRTVLKALQTLRENTKE